MLESQTDQYVDLSAADFLCPLADFHDAFGLRAEVSIRTDALAAFQLEEENLSEDLVVSIEVARHKS